MKAILKAAVIAASLLVTPPTFAQQPSAILPEAQTVSWSQVQEIIKADTQTPVVIEFFNSAADELDCDRCDRQSEVYERIARQYRGKVRFLRVDIAGNRRLVDIGIVGVYPTHLFIDHAVNQGEEIVARRIRGFLTEAELRQLLQEFFLAQP